MRQYSPLRSTPRTRVSSSSARRVLLPSLFAVTALAACGEKRADTLATDTALGRDLALAQRDTAVQPKLQDVPAPTPPPAAAPAPATPAPRPTPRPTTPRPTPKPTPAPTPTPTPPPAAATPAPTPAPAAPASGTVAAGTSMRFTANNKVCSNSSPVGDKFTATLADAVSASNGMSIPAGATGTFEITESKSAQNSRDNTVLKVRLVSVTYGGKTYPVEATVQTASTERVRSATKGDDAKKVAGGAILGGIIGQIIGKNTKGTVIGAAAGAAAGTAAAAATGDYDTCLQNGGAVTVVLDSPVTVRP